jgi:carbon-monoxide dehydrogenase large subunit
MRRANSPIGSPVERIEDLRFLRGRGQYVGDLPADGCLHAAILRSSIAHARIRSVEANAARRTPGVHAVLTAEDIGEPIPTVPLRVDVLPGQTRFQQPVIANRKIRYVGEPIAIVIADDPALAEDALALIELDLEPLRAIADRDAARANESLLFEEAGTNSAGVMTGLRGDADAAFRSAPYVRREHFEVQRFTAMPMESRGLLAAWDAAAATLTLFGAAKAPFRIRRLLAAMLDLPESSVRVVENDVGGGFGVRGDFYPEEFLIPFAARRLGRAVRWIEDRREHLQATSHARDVECDIEIACGRDGVIEGIRAHVACDMGAYIRPNGSVAARNLAQALTGPYRVPNIRSAVLLLLTNKTPVGVYRAPGRFEGDFFRERLFDIVADDLGIDRAEFRRRNLVKETEMPYSLAEVIGLGDDTACDSGDYRITLERCLQEFKWPEKCTLSGKRIDGRYHGVAVGCFIEAGGAGPEEHARLALEADGSISAFVGSSALGQGLETVFTQIAADALDCPMSQIRGVFHGSTDYVAAGLGSYASRSTVMGGSAVMNAAARLKDAIRQLAAHRLGCDPSAVEIDLVEQKAFAAGGKSVAFKELPSAGLAVDATFSCDKRTYSYGAHAAHVAVDPRTGHVRLLDYVAVDDVGRAINPLTLHGQATGAIVQGLGGALLEHLVYDEEAQLLAGSLADYLVPTAGDFPNIRVVTLELKPSPNNPLGAKGAGEGGAIPVGGLIGNAVSAALRSFGVQVRTLPLAPSSVWRLVADAQNPRA